MHLYDFEDAVDVTVAALKDGQTVEELANYFTDVLNAAQRKYEQEHNEAERHAAAEALAKALSIFGKAYTGEEVPVEADALYDLGKELQELVKGLGSTKVVRLKNKPAVDDLKCLATDFLNI